MDEKNTVRRVLMVFGLLIGGLGLQAEVRANDFPTLDRALYIQECMTLRQSQNYETLYACVCTIDKIADAMSYKEFVEADSYMRMRNARGERGGLFRGTERAREVRKRFSSIKADAESYCFPSRVRHMQDKTSQQ